MPKNQTNKKIKKLKSKFLKNPMPIILALLVLGGVTAAVIGVNSSLLAADRKKVIAYYVPWDRDRGFATIQNNATIFTEVSPWAYILKPDGSVVFDPASGGASVVDQASMNLFRSNNIKVIPSISNLVNDQWNGGDIVSNIIANPTATDNHVTNIVNTVVQNNYDGIDIDYENLHATDRTAYSDFMTKLSSALHAKGKLLTTDVYGKTSEPGNWDGPKAQDYAVIGAVADEVRIMLYDYDPSITGPQSPTAWVNDTLAFAKTKMPASKIVDGAPLYGYDFAANTPAAAKTWEEVQVLINQYHPTINWDSTNKVSWFTYTVGGVNHTVWYENSSSTGAKLDLVNQQGIAGIHVWRLGGEDPATWLTVGSKLTTPPTDTTKPVVTMTAPISGDTVSGTTTLVAGASDDIAVAKVEFYDGGTKLGEDTTSPFTYDWNTTATPSGTHILTAKAYDSSNNQATSVAVSVTVKNNLASGKLPTSSSSYFTNPARITDGSTATGEAQMNPGPQWIQIDLGASYNLKNIKLWHYFADSRKYHDVIVQLSNSAGFSSGVTTVFNNDSNNSSKQGKGTQAEYIETSAGKDITFSPVNARYIRLWTNGSTVNTYNHYVEVQAYN